MQSMTGFGNAQGKKGKLDVSIEIRSVNHRFFSLKQSVPDALTRYEGDIERFLRQKVGRGSLTLSVSVKALHPPGPVLPEPKIVEEFLRRLRRLQKAAGIHGEVGIDALLGFPHLWNSVESDSHGIESWSIVRSILDRAVEDLVAMRRREGESIRKDIDARLTNVLKLVAQIQERAPVVLETYQKKLEDRIAALLTQRGLEFAKVDLLKEIAVYADKCDVSEELQRLTSHVDQFRKILTGEGPIGRRLDFLTQEMAREANTITSKCGDSKISSHAVEMKAELEKIKEQVENVE